MVDDRRCTADAGPAWKDAVGRLRRIDRDDRAFVKAAPKTERSLVRATAAGLYVRYMLNSNELTACHDRLVQPQLRIFLRKILMCAFGRILELKRILIGEDFSIYTPVIDELIDMKITYDQFELMVPRCFRNDRRSFLAEIDGKIDEINNRTEAVDDGDDNLLIEEQKESVKMEVSQNVSQESSESSDFDLEQFLSNAQPATAFDQIIIPDDSRELAIKLIQKHIRAMYDRIAVNEMISSRTTRSNIISGKYKPPSNEEGRAAAVKIQRYWRFYRIMVKTRTRQEKRFTLLGMYMSSEKLNSDINHEVQEMVRAQQDEAYIEYLKVISRLEDDFARRSKYELIEDIEDELRAYVWTFFETCHHLPTWPDPKQIMLSDDYGIIGLPPIILKSNVLKQLKIPKVHYMSALKQRQALGGSAIIQTGRWMTIEMAEILAMLIIEFENKPAKERKALTKQLAEKNKIEKDKIAENEKNMALNLAGIKIPGIVLEPSDLTELFKDTFNEYDNDWALYNGPDNKTREDLIKSDIFTKAQVELRAIVDETIEEELNILKKAYARDLKKKYKDPKKKPPKKSRKRKSKGNAKQPDLNEIFEELVKNSLIKKSVKQEFIDFQGEVSLIACVLRREPYFSDPRYGLGDIRQIIKEFCVIGLVYEELRTLKNMKFCRSLLMAGPEKSGKSMLVNAICTETGSLKIELTLKNVIGNYPQPSKINRLVQYIVKFAKANQPVVIEVDLADVPFYKKIPNDLKAYKPKMMVKLLAKLLKSLSPTDRIIVIGKATCPWLTVKSKLSNVFEAIVFTAPDECTIFLFLNELLMNYSIVSRTFPVTSLATMLAGYSRQMIADIVAEVMTTERMLTLRKQPLDPVEFIPAMLRYPKQNPQQFELFHKWYSKYVPMGASRLLEMEVRRTAYIILQKKAQKAKKSKAKKV